MTCYVPALTETDPRQIVLAVQQLAAGRSNAVGKVTLTVSATTTTVTDKNCAVGSTPILTANTANAAAAVATTYVSAVANGSFVLTHASAASTDRTFFYALHG